MSRRPSDTRCRGAVTAFTTLLMTALAVAPALADWPTARGSAQRTGCLDDQPGPKTPAVLWVYKAQENYVASPLVEGGAVYFPALGPFNTGLFRCLATRQNQPAPLWTKQAPFIKRPLVCSPVSTEGLVIFGDGMHQTDDAILYCITADTGRPVWQYLLPGKLVHLEASPAVDRGRVYTGGGAAGVLCLEVKRVVLDGKEMDLADSQDLIERRWKELTDAAARDMAYRAPPNEDALPKPSPKLVWQKGQNQWHVDTPVTVAGDLVLAGSSYLDEESIGKRALLGLRAATGETAWELPLEINPWAGATVAGNLALVGCSSIRLDPDQIAGAAGEVVAADLTTGRVAWRKKVPGGILSPIAVKDGLAVFTATDGRIRAWNAATGDEKWQYDAQKPFFAGPAVAGGSVYAADLTGQLHALQLADGLLRWTFDTANAPGVQMPGMVYGSPVVQRGRIYLTTCNVQGADAGKPCAVLCVADKQAVARGTYGATLQVDKKNRTVSIPCHIAPRKLPTLPDIYPLEVIACFPSPLGQKAHETVVVTEVEPSALHQALLDLGLQPGAPVHGDAAARPTGAEVSLKLETTDITGQPFVVPIEEAIVDPGTGRTLPPLKWYFTGSAKRPGMTDYAANLGGTLVTLFPVTAETVIQSSLAMRLRAALRLDTDKALLPPEDAEARLIVAPRLEREAVALSALLETPSPFHAAAPGCQTPGPETVTELTPVFLRWPAPPSLLRTGARTLPATPATIRQSPIAELPGTAAASATPRPPVRSLPVGPLARAPMPDPALPLSLPPVTRADPDRQGWDSGGARNPFEETVPGKSPPLRDSALPFVRFSVPEPAPSPATVRLSQPGDDLDAPVSFRVPPRAVALPVN